MYSFYHSIYAQFPLIIHLFPKPKNFFSRSLFTFFSTCVRGATAKIKYRKNNILILENVSLLQTPSPFYISFVFHKACHSISLMFTLMLPKNCLHFLNIRLNFLSLQNIITFKNSLNYCYFKIIKSMQLYAIRSYMLS